MRRFYRNWSWTIWVLVFAACVLVGILLNLWAYDGDVKCLVAECRRVK